VRQGPWRRTTVGARQVRLPKIIDEDTREARATAPARSFTADATVAVLDRLIVTLGRTPQHTRMDGPELTVHALADWCRYSGADPAFIEPSSPWQNGPANQSTPLPRRTCCLRTVQHAT